MGAFKIGHFTDDVNLTGVSVILADGNGAVGGVDVRGGSPGTRETDLLRGCNAVSRINGVCLCGGSAYGLSACDGVMKYLRDNKLGHNTGTQIVPIVCGAVVYDLDCGNFAYPESKQGYQACVNARLNNTQRGRIGGGAGATVGKIMGMAHCSDGGVGYYKMTFGKVEVECLVVVNAFGDIVDINDNGKILSGAQSNGQFVDTTKLILSQSVAYEANGSNTTIGCIMTNAVLTREQANKLASIAHNGLAMAISPVHTMMDGDTMFCMASCEEQCEFNQLMLNVVETTRRAILSVVK